MIVVVQFKGMDETGDWHILAFHRSVDRVLNLLLALQTVDGSLSVYLNTGRVDSDIQRVFGACGFLTHDLGTFGAT